MNRYSPIAASVLVAALLVPLFMHGTEKPSFADDMVMTPEGGRLDALDESGLLIGPCPLKHTDVDVNISGSFSRVKVTQQFYNRYDRKIEAVYTFPLSHRAAVDRLTMTVGDRVVIGEVKERSLARQIYEAARAQGYVASLLEQERPNIFTQSVANIEPGAAINIEISYVEMLQSKDGLYSFDFPMVVGPRYIPGGMKTPSLTLPDGVKGRGGVVLLGPAKVDHLAQAGDTTSLGTLQGGKLMTLLHNGVAIEAGRGPTIWYHFTVQYCNGSKESGTLHTNGTGQINGRWFYTDLAAIKDMGAGFAPDTTQVPDASKITPMPVKPGQRAGHDIGLTIAIDTGGPGIKDIDCPQHQVDRVSSEDRPDGLARRVSYKLRKADEIPNRDFVFNWRQTADTIQEATFAHTDKNGNFFTLILQPPQRVADSAAVPRELVFVLDTSGSMSGFPIEKAKQVMSRAIDALRPQDTFNLITFSGDTHILWEKPRPASKANIEAAQAFLTSRQGGGGTEMMKAIHAALVQSAAGGDAAGISPLQLLDLPADGRAVKVHLQAGQLNVLELGSFVHTGEGVGCEMVIEGQRIPVYGLPPASVEQRDKPLVLDGQWITRDRQRVLDVKQWRVADQSAMAPMRICCFMTDGYVGNDMAIIDAVKKNAATTRVFSFGIGNSANRYLLEGMAHAGRGEVEYVLLESDGDEAVQRFTRRIQTPVLTDIRLSISGLQLQDLLPATIPDLFDAKPLVIHGRYIQPGKGTLTVRGNTGTGLWERTIDLDLPAAQPAHDVIGTLWARAQVEELMNRNLAAMQAGSFPDELRKRIVSLGEQFQIMTQFTSFVAVEKSRVTIGGQPMLVAVPIEMPQGVSYEGVFGRPHPTSSELSQGVLSQLRQPDIAEDKAAFEQRIRSRGRQWSDHDYGYGLPAQPGSHNLYFGASGLGLWFARGAATASPSAASVAATGDQITFFDSSIAVGQPPEHRDEGEATTGSFSSAPQANTQQEILVAIQEFSTMAEPARKTLVEEQQLCEKLVLLAEAMAGEDRWTDVTVVVKQATQAIDCDLLKKLSAVLTEEKLPQQERLQQIQALAEKARATLAPRIRAEVMRQRLAPELLALTEGQQKAKEAVQVTVLVRDVGTASLETLKTAGLKIQAVAAPTKLVIGTTEPSKLADLACAEPVRRIERTRH